MTVKERTAGGYVKGEDKNGNTFYRDPNGHPVSQQAFAGSKGGQAYARKYRPVKDPDTGEFTGEREDKPEFVSPPGPPEEPPPPPPPPENKRVVGTLDGEYKPGGATPSAADFDFHIELDAVVPARFTDDEIEERMRELLESAAEDAASEVKPLDTWEDISVDIQRTRASRREHRGELSMEFRYGTYRYDIEDGEVQWPD